MSDIGQFQHDDDDDDICPGCGAHKQATHHPLCEERDGTPTGLTDEQIRAAIELLADEKVRGVVLRYLLSESRARAERDEIYAERAKILALLDAPTRASFEAEAKEHREDLLDLIGYAVYGINVDGSIEQLAELINRGYRGTDDILRSVETALAIARGETAEAKAAREAREIEERRKFVEWSLDLARSRGLNVEALPRD
jgi:hypothetical protein